MTRSVSPSVTRTKCAARSTTARLPRSATGLRWRPMKASRCVCSGFATTAPGGSRYVRAWVRPVATAALPRPAQRPRGGILLHGRGQNSAVVRARCVPVSVVHTGNVRSLPVNQIRCVLTERPCPKGCETAGDHFPKLTVPVRFPPPARKLKIPASWVPGVVATPELIRSCDGGFG